MKKTFINTVHIVVLVFSNLKSHSLFIFYLIWALDKLDREKDWEKKIKREQQTKDELVNTETYLTPELKIKIRIQRKKLSEG